MQTHQCTLTLPYLSINHSTSRANYYHVPTFWQSDTLQFVSREIKGFRPQNSSGSCLNYLIPESWFLFDENEISCCCCRKGDHLLTICHRMSHPAANMHSEILELRLKMPWDVAQIFSESLHKNLLQPRHNDLKPGFWHHKLTDHTLSSSF